MEAKLDDIDDIEDELDLELGIKWPPNNKNSIFELRLSEPQPKALQRPLTNHNVIARSTTDRKLGGVLGGLARMLNVDASILRVGFAGLTLGFPVLIIMYIICWMAIPKDTQL